MHHHSHVHHTWAALFLTALLVLGIMTACNQNEPDEPSTDTGTPSTTDTAAVDTEPTTEDETILENITTPETMPELTPAEPVLDNSFTITEVFHVPPNEKEETVDVQLPGAETTITINAHSTFYGSQSAIKRGTWHWANIFRYSQQCVCELDTEFRIGDLNDDRVGEIITFTDGTLVAYNKSLTKAVYTQSLGFDGFLCGAGRFNDDYYTDILLYSRDAESPVLGIGSPNGFSYQYVPGYTYAEGDIVYTGDYDADTQEDLVIINGISVTTYQYDQAAFVLNKTTPLPFATTDMYILYTVSDVNSDGADDVIGFMKDPDGGKTQDGYDMYGTCCYLSQRDGQFGTYEGEENNMNINITYISDTGIVPLMAAGGDITGDGVDDIALIGLNPEKETAYLYAVVYPEEAPAYDYSSHVIKTDEGYILYTGGLYADNNTDKYIRSEGDHTWAYTSEDGYTWHRNLDAACFPLGVELGESYENDLTPGTYDNWWVGNTIEPEVIYVDGIYYMYYQCEYYQLDKEGVLMGADRIGVATSTDGIHFERKTDSPALITSDIYSWFHHQEVIYVPDDPDGKCFWMYVNYVHNNREHKRVRIRSADPLCFNMDEDYTECTGFSHTGNQIGYISNYDGQGNRLFLRICPADYQVEGKRPQWVATLQFSSDGIHWTSSDLRFAGVDQSIRGETARRNIFFIGFSTINGTGELAKTEDGTGYEFFFIGATGTLVTAPEIFQSDEGLGRVVLTIDVKE